MPAPTPYSTDTEPNETSPDAASRSASPEATPPEPPSPDAGEAPPAEAPPTGVPPAEATGTEATTSEATTSEAATSPTGDTPGNGTTGGEVPGIDGDEVAAPEAEPGETDSGGARAATQPAAPTETVDASEDGSSGEDTAGQPDADAAGQHSAKGRKQEKKKQKPTISPAEITRTIGTTSERALEYVRKPDQRLARLPRKVRENVITEIPPVTAGALLGVAALARHFVASAATGRYRDLFHLWELFRTDPETCKPVLAERQATLGRARQALETATRLGLRGRTELVQEDISRAEGLIWQWLRGALLSELPAVGARPAIASAMLLREPDLEVPLPAEPDDRWLSEAAAVADAGQLAPAVEKVFGAHLDRLPGTVATLSLAYDRFPGQVEALVDRVDLGSPEIGALLAWARDHGQAARLHARIAERIEQEVANGSQQALALWWSWRERGIDVALPGALRSSSIDDFDLTRPETAELAAILVRDGAQFDVQERLDALAGENRQLAEKAYEAFVCAGHDVHLPPALRDNKTVKEGTRCPYCEAWTWVRPGHERRCPRAAAGEKAPPPPSAELGDDWSVGTPATASSTPSQGSAALPSPEPEPAPTDPGTTAEAPQAAPPPEATAEQSDEPADPTP